MPPVQAREAGDKGASPRNGGPDDPLYYETLEATMLFDSQVLEVPAYVGKRLRL